MSNWCKCPEIGVFGAHLRVVKRVESLACSELGGRSREETRLEGELWRQ